MEKPILFNTEMVQAILDGRKTQTRRVIKPQPCEWVESISFNQYQGRWEFTGDEGGMMSHASSFPGQPLLKCPYGKPGDELWVRETWRTSRVNNLLKPSDLSQDDKIEYVESGSQCLGGRIRQSIFMMRWMSRIQLTIKGVRVERVQEISDGEALAEGVKGAGGMGGGLITLRDRFQELWNSINEKRGRGWDSNPWVWVVEFEVKQ